MDREDNSNSVLTSPNMDRQLYGSAMRAITPPHLQELEETVERLGHALDKLGERGTPLPRYESDAFRKGMISQGRKDFPAAPKMGEAFSQSAGDDSGANLSGREQKVESVFGTEATRAEGRMDRLEQGAREIGRVLNRLPGV